MKACIVIPARYNSTRFPGKPLAMLAGKTMLEHVCAAASKVKNANILVATDDDRILKHAHALHIDAVMTPESCATGSDRVLAAVSTLQNKPEFVINLQGDTPLMQAEILQALVDAGQHSAIVTPAVQLKWDLLDVLRTAKQQTPFSGTTVIIDQDENAVWFSKQIIPAIRNETQLRTQSKLSPVYQHIGVYGYSLEMLEIFSRLPSGHYEQLEGLEQLRLIENGYKLKVVKVDLPDLNAWRGIDTPEDLKFAENILLEKL